MTTCPTCHQPLGPYRGDRLWRNGTPARIYDLLEADGGWVSTLYLIDTLDAADSTVRHALSRLRRRGMVEAKPARQRYEPWHWRAIPTD